MYANGVSEHDLISYVSGGVLQGKGMLARAQEASSKSPVMQRQYLGAHWLCFP